MHFTAFHPDFKMPDIAPTPPSTLTRARTIALANGVHYAYTGNVHDRDGGSTYCHGCGTRVIERDWYVIGDYRLDRRRALPALRRRRVPGRFDGPAGNWGARRAARSASPTSSARRP